MIPEYPKFKKLDFEDRAALKKALKEVSPGICELALGNIYIWQNFDRDEITCLNGNLCLRINPLKEPAFFLEPFGTKQANHTVDQLLMDGHRLSRFSEAYVKLLTPNKYLLSPLRDQFDYVYLRQEMAEMKGTSFDGKRNHIKNFERSEPGYAFVSLEPAMKTQVLALFDLWASAQPKDKDSTRPSFTAQREAIGNAFKYFQPLKIHGGALFSAKKELLGFILGSGVNPETVSLHFAYGKPDIPGVTPMLFFDAANKIFSEYKYLNMEQDLGIPGLRRSKLSYHPVKLEQKFEVTLK